MMLASALKEVNCKSHCSPSSRILQALSRHILSDSCYNILTFYQLRRCARGFPRKFWSGLLIKNARG